VSEPVENPTATIAVTVLGASLLTSLGSGLLASVWLPWFGSVGVSLVCGPLATFVWLCVGAFVLSSWERDQERKSKARRG
jgi:hypothetical protein